MELLRCKKKGKEERKAVRKERALYAMGSALYNQPGNLL